MKALILVVGLLIGGSVFAGNYTVCQTDAHGLVICW